MPAAAGFEEVSPGASTAGSSAAGRGRGTAAADVGAAKICYRGKLDLRIWCGIGFSAGVAKDVVQGMLCRPVD